MNERVESAGGRTPRVVRVFVSSTFRDMQPERDELIKRTFPRLRKLCQQRGVTWSEVDLRWGITEQQAERGEVLPICLAEIKRCRPYFIGLLGERYGWVPEKIPRELIDAEPWLADHLDHSVTELEILHGVLANPAMASHAFFYLRDPACLQTMPAAARADYVESPSADEIQRLGMPEAELRARGREQKLAALKERIGASGFPVRKGYATPQALGELVLRDMTAVIDRLYPEGSAPEPLEREANDHEAFAESRAKVYVPRPSNYEALDRHVVGDGPPLVVVGESGSGKSALVANWVLRYRSSLQRAPARARESGWARLVDRFKPAGDAKDSRFVLMHFVGATPHSADWALMLTRILEELKKRGAAHEEIPSDPDALRAAFARGLTRAAARTRIVLVIDGLDQLEDRDQARNLVWLPRQIPANIRVILSSLPGRALDELRKRGWPTLEVGLLGLDERRQLIREYLNQFAKALSPPRLERIAASAQTANPLYLRALLDELRVFGVHEQLDSRIEHYLRAPTIEDLYDRLLERYEDDYERDRPGLVRDVFSMLWAARRGLAEAELLELLGARGNPLPGALWSPLFLAADQSLVNRSGLLGFLHRYLREAVRKRYVCSPGNEIAAHRRLADYFHSGDLDGRKVDELPWQLSKAGAWQELAELLCQPEFLNRAWQAARFDAQSFWTQIEANSGIRAVDAYRGVLQAAVDDPTYGWNVSLLLSSMGHPNDVMALQDRLIAHYRESGDTSNLAGALGNQASARYELGECGAAMALLKEQEAVSRASNNQRLLGHALAGQARVLYLQGEAGEAERLFDSAARIARQAGDLWSLAYWIGNQTGILMDRGDLAGALRQLKEQERICREQGDQEGLSLCLGNQAHVLRTSGELDAALALLEEKEKISLEIGHAAGVAQALGERASVLTTRGSLKEAAALLERQAEMFRRAGNAAGVAGALGDQGRVYESRGEFVRALDLFQEQERICRALGDKKGLQAALGNQFEICSKRGDVDRVTALLDEGAGICRAIGDTPALLVWLNNEAVMLERQGRLEEAMTIFKRVENAGQKTGYKPGVAGALANQGLIRWRQGKLDEAMSMFKAHETSCRALGDKRNLAASLNNQALILRARGDLDGALRLCREQKRICREMGAFDDLQSALRNEAETLEVMGDLDAALALRGEAEAICRRVGNKRSLQAALAGRASILETRGALTEAMALLKEQELICREIADDAALARALGNQAVVLRTQSNLPAALSLHQEQEGICRRLNDKAGLQACYGSQGVLQEHMGNLPEALRLLKLQEEICRELNDKDGLQRSLGDQANVYSMTGDFQRSLALHDEEEQICRELGNVDQLQGAIGNRAGVLMQLGRIDEAMDLFKEKEGMCRELGNVNGLAGALANQAVLLVQHLNRPADALPLADEAYSLAESHGLVARARQIKPLRDYLRGR